MASYTLDTLPEIEESLEAAVNDIVLVEVTKESHHSFDPRFIVSVRSHDNSFNSMRCEPSFFRAKRSYRRLLKQYR